MNKLKLSRSFYKAREVVCAVPVTMTVEAVQFRRTGIAEWEPGIIVNTDQAIIDVEGKYVEKVHDYERLTDLLSATVYFGLREG